MRDLRSALAGIHIPPRNATIVLRDAGPIGEIERLLEQPGIDWTAAFERRCDEVSLALFGVTKADTEPHEPHPDDVQDKGQFARWTMNDDALLEYDRRLSAWYELKECFTEYLAEIDRRGLAATWRGRGFDVTDGVGVELRCIPYFHRQLYVAQAGVLPGAKLTLDGGGRRAPQSVDAWAATLEAEARRFRPSR